LVGGFDEGGLTLHIRDGRTWAGTMDSGGY